MVGQDKVLISACLLGCETRYDGKGQRVKLPEELLESAIPVCPEQLGGLPTPREPSEIKDDYIIDFKGINRTEEFNKGALESLQIAQMLNIKFALLKESSPSCGVHKIYDGTFTGQKISGSGITTRLLRKHGIKVFSEEEIDLLLEELGL